MSGICVLIHFDGSPVDPLNLQKMVEPVTYRGPDSIHHWVHQNAGLAHLALNTTPESRHEHQPLVKESASLCLTADARLDNRSELLPLLHDYLPYSQPTDADLILAAYQRWQEASPQYLIGDFAFAIWDGRKQQLFCARDPFGVRPLHYGRFGSLFLVASEAQQILHHPAVPRRLEERAIADYLSNNILHEDITFFQGIHRLCSAHCLIATSDQQTTRRYWDIQPDRQIRYPNEADYPAHFLELFRRCVTDRLRTHQPVIGAEVSGGIDSTSIVAMAHNILSQQPGSPHLVACTYAFDQLKECDERSYSQTLTTQFGVEIQPLPAEQFSYFDNPDLFSPTLETPYLTWESLQDHLLTYLKGRGAQILLYGHHAERINLGTPHVYADRFWRGRLGVLWELARLATAPYPRVLYNYLLEPALPASFLRAIRRRLGHDRGSRLPNWIMPGLIQRTQLIDRFEPPLLPHRFPSLAQKTLYWQAFTRNPYSPIFYWYDRTAARYGIEARQVYLDRRLADFLLNIPPEQLYHQGYYKWIVRRAMTGILPNPIRWRLDKTKFDPYNRFSWEKATHHIQDLFTKPLLISEFGFVQADKFSEQFTAYHPGQSNNPPDELWPAITLEVWLRKYHTLFSS